MARCDGERDGERSAEESQPPFTRRGENATCLYVRRYVRTNYSVAHKTIERKSGRRDGGRFEREGQGAGLVDKRQDYCYYSPFFVFLLSFSLLSEAFSRASRISRGRILGEDSSASSPIFPTQITRRGPRKEIVRSSAGSWWFLSIRFSRPSVRFRSAKATWMLERARSRDAAATRSCREIAGEKHGCVLRVRARSSSDFSAEKRRRRYAERVYKMYD